MRTGSSTGSAAPARLADSVCPRHWAWAIPPCCSLARQRRWIDRLHAALREPATRRMGRGRRRGGRHFDRSARAIRPPSLPRSAPAGCCSAKRCTAPSWPTRCAFHGSRCGRSSSVHHAKWHDWADTLDLQMRFQPLAASSLSEWLQASPLGGVTPRPPPARHRAPSPAARGAAPIRRAGGAVPGRCLHDRAATLRPGRAGSLPHAVCWSGWTPCDTIRRQSTRFRLASPRQFRVPRLIAAPGGLRRQRCQEHPPPMPAYPDHREQRPAGAHPAQRRRRAGRRM